MMHNHLVDDPIVQSLPNQNMYTNVGSIDMMLPKTTISPATLVL